MKERISVILISAALIALSLSIMVWAGGPNNLNGPGKYYRWNPYNPVPYSVDLGSLGALNNPDAVALVDQATQTWNDVQTATIRFQKLGFLPQDITVNNYEALVLSDIHPENPVIFDNSGSIIDDFLGTNSGTTGTTLGFAGIRFTQGDEFLSAWAVLNGRAVTPGSVEKFTKTVIHELGHLLGLDHTQGLIENYDNYLQFGMHVPLMFPIGGFQPSPEEPIQDDIAWLSWIYPEPGFREQTGTIKGQVFRLRSNGPPLQGAHVTAIPAIPDGLGGFSESRQNVTACVSDFLIEGTGEYELPGLQPGAYFVRIDRIRSEFTGGSGIGPFDDRPDNFPRDYFDVNESGQEDDLNQKALIQVAAGQVVSGIDMVADEIDNAQRDFVRLTSDNTAPVVLDLDDDDALLVLFPENFTFPFFGRVYPEVYVNSDGNLTFGVGDARPGEPRTVARFLQGPPRIAPLFTDLDPSLVGRVTAQVAQGSITFTWEGVPEFRESPPAGGPNTFTVTLSSNGDIRYRFVQISVTPDSDDQFPLGLQAISGVAPGNAQQGQAVNLSNAASLLMGDTAVYEPFPGTTFDLASREIFFEAGLTELVFPLLRGDRQNFTGYAVTDYGSQDLTLNFEARSDQGQIQPYPQNPSSEDLLSESQFANLGREIFGIAPGTAHNGWVRMISTRPEVASFFQFGNGLTGSLTRMDGSTAFTSRAERFFFTRIFDGDQVFPSYSGFLSAQTTLYVVNPNDQQITVTMSLYNNFGAAVRPPVTRQIAAFGRLVTGVRALFGLTSPLPDGFVEVQVDQGLGAVGFQTIELEDTLLGLNAASENPGTVLYSAQLGHSQDIFTNVKIVNTTNDARFVTLTAYLRRPNGSIDTRTAQFQLNPQRRALEQDVQSIFGLGPGGTDPLVGSIVIESTGPGIVGDVVFGDPQSARFAAALPLQTQTFMKAVHSQVSNGIVAGSPTLSSFTGLALFNPNVQFPAQVTVEVFDRDGVKKGETTVALNARERISQTVVELVPESAGLVRGYIVLTASRPIVAQELFGNVALDYLSAVVPALLE